MLERRNGSRWTVRPEAFVTVDSDCDEIQCQLLDAGPTGFRASTERPLGSRSQLVRVRFSDGKNISGTLAARTCHEDQCGTDVRVFVYGFELARPVPPEDWQWFAQYFDEIVPGPISRRSFNERARKLATMDFEALSTRVLHGKRWQFKLVTVGLTLFTVLLAPAFSFLLSPEKVPPWWVTLLPMAALLLALPMFAVFLQKIASAARQQAFILLLQRYLICDCFPKCYRGWHDAHANLNHLMKYGADARSPLKVSWPPEDTKRRFPADTFRIFGVFVFVIVPIISLAVLWALAYMTGFGASVYTISVAITTALLLIAYTWFYRYMSKLVYGKLSYDYMVIAWSRILKYAPPFDPYRNGPYE